MATAADSSTRRRPPDREYKCSSVQVFKNQKNPTQNQVLSASGKTRRVLEVDAILPKMRIEWPARQSLRVDTPCAVSTVDERVLRKCATVVSMDKFRTSKLCSKCHQTLSSVRYSVDTRLPKRKKRKGVVLVRNRAEVEFEQKKCHAVLRCDHKECEARYWDRDVNAAINMLELLKSEVLGLEFVQEMRKQTNVEMRKSPPRQTWIFAEGDLVGAFSDNHSQSISMVVLKSITRRPQLPRTAYSITFQAAN